MVNFLPNPHNRHPIASTWGDVYCDIRLGFVSWLSHCSVVYSIMLWYQVGSWHNGTRLFQLEKCARTWLTFILYWRISLLLFQIRVSLRSTARQITGTMWRMSGSLCSCYDNSQWHTQGSLSGMPQGEYLTQWFLNKMLDLSWKCTCSYCLQNWFCRQYLHLCGFPWEVIFVLNP